MSFFDRFKKKKAEKHELTEDDRDKSAITNLERTIRKQRIDYLKRRLEQMKQVQEEQLLEQQLQDLEYDTYGDEDEDENPAELVEQAQNNPEALFTNLLMNAFTKNRAPPGSPAPPPNPSTLKDYSDDEINAILQQTGPAAIAQLKILSDEKLINLIRQKYPDASDASIMRTIELLRK